MEELLVPASVAVQELTPGESEIAALVRIVVCMKQRKDSKLSGLNPFVVFRCSGAKRRARR